MDERTPGIEAAAAMKWRTCHEISREDGRRKHALRELAMGREKHQRALYGG
jgi:hypothetical protein